MCKNINILIIYYSRLYPQMSRYGIYVFLWYLCVCFLFLFVSFCFRLVSQYWFMDRRGNCHSWFSVGCKSEKLFDLPLHSVWRHQSDSHPPEDFCQYLIFFCLSRFFFVSCHLKNIYIFPFKFPKLVFDQRGII